MIIVTQYESNGDRIITPFPKPPTIAQIQGWLHCAAPVPVPDWPDAWHNPQATTPNAPATTAHPLKSPLFGPVVAYLRT